MLSTEAPKGVFVAKYKGAEIDETTNVYEYETISLDASESLAAVSGTDGIKIKSVEWVILKDGLAYAKVKKSSTAAFDYVLGEAGTYDFAFEIINTLGLKAASNRLFLDVKMNMPSISNIEVSDFFEGVAGPIDFIVNESPSDIKGEIASVVLTIEGLEPFVIEDVENVMWTPPYDGDSFADKYYVAFLTIKNEAGREFISEDFTLKVKDNNPRPNLTASKEAVMYDDVDIIEFVASGSYSPDGGSLDELSFVIEKEGVLVANTSHDFLEDMNTAFAPDVFQGASSVGVYFAVLTARAGDRVQSTRKMIRVTPRTALASFIISPDPDNTQIFEGHEITIDASDSKDSNKVPIANENFSWLVTNNGESTGRVPENVGPGLFKYKFKEDDFGSFAFELTVTGDDGTTGDFTKEFFVNMNKPTNLKVSRQPSALGIQVLLGEVECPDGNYATLIYNWYDELPGPGVVPDSDKTNVNPVTYAYDDGLDHVIYYEVINAYGFSSVLEYVLKADDLIPPEVPIVTTDYVKVDVVNDIAVTNETRPTWRWYANDPNDDAIEWRYAVAAEGAGEPANPETWTKVKSPNVQYPTVLSPGRYTIYVQAGDDAEPVQNWSISGKNTLEIDTEAPVAPVMNTNIDSYNVTGRTKDGKPTWSWEPGQASDTYKYRYRLGETGQWNIVENTVKTFTPSANLNDGLYELFVQAIDKAGNTSPSASSTWAVDNVPPIITLNAYDPEGEMTDIIIVNVDKLSPPFSDPGAIAYDESMGQNVAVTIIGEAAVDLTQKNQDFEITFTAEDDLGNEAIAYRSVQVRDIEDPVITLIGGPSVTIYMDDAYVEPGYTATDNCDGDLTSSVTTQSNLDRTTAGIYQIQYSVTDSSSNTGRATREVRVLPKAVNFLTQLEMDMLTDNDPVELEWGMLQGVNAYDVSRASHFNGPYTFVDTVDLPAFNEDPGYGVFFYKIQGFAGTLEGKESAIVKVARVPESPVSNILATGKAYSTSQIRLTWDNVPGVAGYRLSHSSYDLGNSNIVFNKNTTSHIDAAVQLNIAQGANPQYVVGSSGNPAPAYENYFWVQAYVDKEAAGWVSGGRLYTNPNANAVIGLRNLTNEEWIREVNLSIWHALQVIIPLPGGSGENAGTSGQQEIAGGGSITGFRSSWTDDYNRGYVLEDARPRYLTINGVVADLYQYRNTNYARVGTKYQRNVRVTFSKTASDATEFISISGVYPGEFRYHMHLNTGFKDNGGGPPPYMKDNGVCAGRRCTYRDYYDYLSTINSKFPRDATHIGYPYQIKRDGASSATDVANTAAMWDFHPNLGKDE